MHIHITLYDTWTYSTWTYSTIRRTLNPAILLSITLQTKYRTRYCINGPHRYNWIPLPLPLPLPHPVSSLGLPPAPPNKGPLLLVRLNNTVIARELTNRIRPSFFSPSTAWNPCSVCLSLVSLSIVLVVIIKVFFPPRSTPANIDTHSTAAPKIIIVSVRNKEEDLLQ